MPLWDSVQRGLEKASQEAARMARVQRLRTTADGLALQMNTTSSAIINKTMELFLAGQIAQPEISQLCQQLESFKQQFEQVQAELRQVQAAQQAQAQYPPALQAPAYPPPAGDISASYPYISGGEQTEIAPPPPEFQSAMDYSGITPAPPPPPEVAAYAPPPPITGTPRCTSCGALVQPNHAFCQNCGAPIQRIEQGYQPTVRGSDTSQGTVLAGSDETMRAPQPPGQPAGPNQNQGGM